MTKTCDRIEELILNALSREMTADQELEVVGHIAQCSACRDFQKALQQDDQQLTVYADAVSLSVSHMPERVIAAIDNRASEAPRTIPLWRKIMRSRTSQVAAVAAVLIAAVVTVLIAGSQTALAQIVQALQNVNRVHIVKVETSSDGKVAKEEWWFEKPNHLRQEDSWSVTVDDGVNRLYLGRAKKTAQLSDSHLAYSPIEKNDVFKSTDFFQSVKTGDADVGVKLTPLPDEQVGAILVYALEIASKSEGKRGTGKLWVAADTKLPLRLKGEAREGPGKDRVHVIEYTWSYDPIPADVFSTAIPAGYTELPRKKRGALRGQVLDEQGAPVADAVVYVTAIYDITLEGKTDVKGSFEIKLPPDNVKPISFPVFVAAFRPDDPDRMAWTLITDPNKTHENEELRRVCPIPGNPGQCEILTGHGSPQLGSASGIVLKMEPAGRVHGTVTDIEGRPIPGAAVKLSCSLVDHFGNVVHLGGPDIEPRTPSSDKTATAVADAKGHYEITNVPRLWDKAYFHMSVRAEGFVLKRGQFRSQGPLVSKEMTYQLYRAGFTVTGRATNDRGESLVNYDVVAIVDGTSCSFITKTDATGRFAISKCPITPNLKVRLQSDYPATIFEPNTVKLNPSHVYYQPVEAGIKYEAGKTAYEVNLVATTPDITLTVVLKDTAGRPVPHFPVELRHGPFHTEEWMNTSGRKRTDANGVCVFKGMPQGQRMDLTLYGRINNRFLFDNSVTEEKKKDTDAENRKYREFALPVNLAPEPKEQTIEVTLLTRDEWEAKKAAQ